MSEPITLDPQALNLSPELGAEESPDDKPEKVFTEEEYRRTARGLVHFSFKTTNSNIEAGGIRLNEAAALKLPYLGVRTLLGRVEFPLEVRANAADAIPMLRRFDTAAKCEDDHSLMLQDIYKAETGSALFDNVEYVNSRLPQIYLPLSESEDIVVTPLMSASVATLLAKAVQEHNAAARTDKNAGGPVRRKRIRQAIFPIGGANPQNVGYRVYGALRPLVVFPPTRSLSIRRVKSLQHKGVDLSLPSALLKGYAKFRQEALKAHKGVMPTTQDYRDQEKRHVQAIIEEVLAESERLYELLCETVADQPRLVQPESGMDSAGLSSSVALVVRGAMCAEARTAEWRVAFADEMAIRIAEHPVMQGKSAKLPGISGDGIAQIATWIREVLV